MEKRYSSVPLYGVRHNRYPAHGTGYLESYITYSKNISVKGYSIDGHVYDWDNMPYQYTSSSTAEQKNAVAQLMHDCGVMVQMDYSASGSGAYSTDILPELVEHMGYAKSARYLNHAQYKHDEWFILIASEINKGRLVLYDGVDLLGAGGHEFVCDGYDSAGENIYFNLNPGRKRPGSVAWYYDGKSCPKGYAVAQAGVHTIKAVVSYDDAGWSDTVSLQIEVK